MNSDDSDIRNGTADKQKFTTTSFRVSTEDLAEIDECAEREGRNRTFIFNKAIRQYIRARNFQLARIAQGGAEANSGSLLPNADVMAQFHENLKS